MIAWMVYGTVVGGLLALGAGVVEVGLRRHDRAARGVWGFAMLGTLAAPLARWQGLWDGRSVGTGIGAGAFGDPDSIAGTSVLAAADLWGVVPSVQVGWAWAAASAAVGSAFLLALGRTRSRVRRWPSADVDGTRVRLSPGFGPAVVGFLRPDVVLPRSVLRMDAPDRDLLLRHEREHVRAHDPLLLAAAGVVLVLVPWNPALWFQALRLRDAVELDCDRRVTRGRRGDARRYGGLLVDLAARPTALAGLPFRGRGHRALRRRIRRLAVAGRRASRLATLGLGAMGVALVALACEVPTPPPTEAQGEGKPPTPTEIVGQAASGTHEPLIYLDGVRMGWGKAALRELDPDDIERIEVIKGPAAAVTYGEDGQYGVIQIYLKGDVLR